MQFAPTASGHFTGSIGFASNVGFVEVVLQGAGIDTTPPVSDDITITICTQDGTLTGNLTNTTSGWAFTISGGATLQQAVTDTNGCVRIEGLTGNTNYNIQAMTDEIPSHLTITGSVWSLSSVYINDSAITNPYNGYLTGGATYNFRYTYTIDPVDGVWGDWVPGQRSSCIIGTQTRTMVRSCQTGAVYGGTGCLTNETEVSIETQSCTPDEEEDTNNNPSPSTSRKRRSSGGGGSVLLEKDYCPGGDYSPSYYDKQCGEYKEKKQPETTKKEEVTQTIKKVEEEISSEQTKSLICQHVGNII